MKRRILKRPQAERDIEECFVYIGEDNFDAALSFLTAVEKSLDLLSAFPFSGSKRNFGPGYGELRMWVIGGFEKHEIFYLINDESVDVVRVLHSARDIRSIFDS